MGTRLISAYCDRLSWAVCSRPEWACICTHLSSICITIIIFIILSGTSFNVNLSVGGSFNHEHASAQNRIQNTLSYQAFAQS